MGLVFRLSCSAHEILCTVHLWSRHTPWTGSRTDWGLGYLLSFPPRLVRSEMDVKAPDCFRARCSSFLGQACEKAFEEFAAQGPPSAQSESVPACCHNGGRRWSPLCRSFRSHGNLGSAGLHHQETIIGLESRGGWRTRFGGLFPEPGLSLGPYMISPGEAPSKLRLSG